MASSWRTTCATSSARAAAERTGLYFTCINSYLTADEVAYIVDDCEAKVVRHVGRQGARSPSRRPALTPERRASSCASTPTRRSGRSSPTTTPSPRFPATPIDDEQLGAAMLYSSGTTGRPKGILRPLPEAHPATPLALMDFVKQHVPLPRGHDVPLAGAAVPLGAAGVACRRRCASAATSVIMERFDPEQYLALVERHRITHSQMVPTMFSRMLKLPDDVRDAATTCRRSSRIIHAAAPCPVPVKQDDDRVVRPDHHRVLRRHRGQRVHVLRQRGVAGPPGHRRQADRSATLLILDDDGNEVAARARPGTVWFDGRHQLRVLQRPGEDGREPQRQRHRLDGRRRRLRRRRRLPLPHRPQDLHDHLGRREHLPAGDREPADHPPEGDGRRGDRRAQRGPRRRGQGRRPGDGRHRARARRSSRS